MRCSDNYIGALGAAVLANALKGNAALTGLHIKGNELGNEGVKALCEAFRARDGRVSALDFGNNRRGGDAVFRTSARAHPPLFCLGRQARRMWFCGCVVKTDHYAVVWGAVLWTFTSASHFE